MSVTTTKTPSSDRCSFVITFPKRTPETDSVIVNLMTAGVTVRPVQVVQKVDKTEAPAPVKTFIGKKKSVRKSGGMTAVQHLFEILDHSAGPVSRSAVFSALKTRGYRPGSISQVIYKLSGKREIVYDGRYVSRSPSVATAS